jgi:hypothetical protein
VKNSITDVSYGRKCMYELGRLPEGNYPGLIYGVIPVLSIRDLGGKAEIPYGE